MKKLINDIKKVLLNTNSKYTLILISILTVSILLELFHSLKVLSESKLSNINIFFILFISFAIITIFANINNLKINDNNNKEETFTDEQKLLIVKRKFLDKDIAINANLSYFENPIHCFVQIHIP